MKFCYNCGAEIEEGSKFCVECGAELGLVDVVEQNAESGIKTNAKKISTVYTGVTKSYENNMLIRENERVEAERREAEQREMERREAERRETEQREAERIRLEKLDREQKLHAEEIKRKEAEKRKKNKAVAAALLTVVAIAAVFVSIMIIKKYNKSAKSSDTNKEDSTYHVVGNINDTTEKTTQKTTQKTTEILTQATETIESKNKKEYLELEDLPKYFDDNLTLAQIGIILYGYEYAKGREESGTNEELFNSIIESIWCQIPGLSYDTYHETGDDKFYYEYLRYSYKDIKRMFMIMFTSDEFDRYAANRNGYRQAAVIDKDSDVFSIFGAEYNVNDDTYDMYMPNYFYTENGVYYIQYGGYTFVAHMKNDGKLKINIPETFRTWD